MTARSLATCWAHLTDTQTLPANFCPSGELRLDSRRVQAGDIFLAMAGTQRHGADYLADALRRGAACVVSDTKLGEIAVPALTVPNLTRILYDLVLAYYQVDFSTVRICAVTGTNGKSSIVSQVAYAAERLGYGACQIGTVHYAGPQHAEDPRETTPHFVEILRLLARWQRARSDLVLGIEASSHALDQARLGQLPVDVAILTNISHDHLDYHGSMATYAAAKHKLFMQPSGQHANAAIVPVDAAEASQAARLAGRRVTTVGAGGEFAYRSASRPDGGLSLQLSNGVEATVRFVASGNFQAPNGAATFAAFSALGHAACDIEHALSDWPGLAGRMELVLAQPFLAFVDYAHTPAALEAVLTSAREYVAENGRLCCVFGCGGNRDSQKRPAMGALAAALADRVVVTSDNPRDESPQAIVDAILSGVADRRRIEVELDRRTAIATTLSGMRPGDVLVVAGKGHETGQVVGEQILPFDDREELRRWSMR